MAFEQNRVLDFEHLVVLGEDAAGAVDQPDVIVTVRVPGRAGSALQGEEQDVHKMTTPARVVTRDGKTEETVPACRDRLRHRIGQGPEDRIRDRTGDRIAECRGRRKCRVEEGAFRVDDPDRPVEAGIVGDVGVDQHEEGQHRGRRGSRERGVDEAGRLRRRARIVENYAAALDRRLQADRHFGAVGHAVVENRAFPAIAAVRDRLDLARHHAFGRGEQRLLVGAEHVDPVTLDQLDDPALAHRRAADLRLDVLLDDGVADVREDRAPDILAPLAAVEDFERRDAERLLPDFARIRVVAAGDRAADIGLMALAGGPADRLAVEENRAEYRDIVVLVAAGEDVVVQENVARVHVVSEKIDDCLAHRLEGEGEHRDIFGLLQHVAGLVVEPGDEIARLVEYRRARGPEKSEPHLLGDRFEPALDHRSEDGIDLDAHAPRSVRIRVPKSSTAMSNPAGTKAAVSGVSTIAGPLPRNPAGSVIPSRISIPSNALRSGR